MFRIRFPALWLVVLAHLTVAPRSAPAQDVNHVTVALVDALLDSTAVAVIIRTAGPKSQSTILLREQSASAAVLASAITALFESHRAYGEQPPKRLVISLRGAKPLEALTPNERRLGEIYLARLRAAKVAELDDVGRVRATSMALGAVRD